MFNQIKMLITQIEHSIVKNLNWTEANQLAIYKRGRAFELGTTEKQIQVVARVELEPGTAGLRVRHADHTATLPRIREGLFSIRSRSRLGFGGIATGHFHFRNIETEDMLVYQSEFLEQFALNFSSFAVLTTKGNHVLNIYFRGTLTLEMTSAIFDLYETT